MTAKLIVEEGALKGLTFVLDKGELWIIGRDADEAQFVVDDPLISRKHLQITKKNQTFEIENLSSINPILVNEREIEGPYILAPNDRIQIGQTLFLFTPQTEDIPTTTSSLATQEEEPFLERIDEEPQAEESQAETSSLQEENIPSAAPSPEEPLIFDREDTLSTVWEEKEAEKLPLAAIDFNIIEMGRWLLKVVGGPHNGAEFYMQPEQTYILGTDPETCQIVFHDKSVSRQHAKITINAEDELFIEDINSRNGVLIDGLKIEQNQILPLNTVITLGTTSFVVYDREGDMQTIISPILPSFISPPPPEEKPIEAPSPTPAAVTPPSAQPKVETPPPIESSPVKPKKSPISLLLIAALLSMFFLVGVGITSLFKPHTEKVKVVENATAQIEQALKPFPTVHFTFNKANNSILLLGHLSTPSDKTQLLYNLQNLKFLKSIDDSGIVIDEYVWQEANSILAKTWPGVTIHSPAAGQFVLSGYLQTRKQAEQLSSYISLNFPYLDLLKKQIVVEEDIVQKINSWLLADQLSLVNVKINKSDVTLSGVAPSNKMADIQQIIQNIKQIPNVRAVNNFIQIQAPELAIKNISAQYPVSGQSKIGNKYTVVINGRILSEGDSLDGMEIQKITNNMVFLQKGETKYRIDY